VRQKGWIALVVAALVAMSPALATTFEADPKQPIKAQVECKTVVKNGKEVLVDKDGKEMKAAECKPAPANAAAVGTLEDIYQDEPKKDAEKDTSKDTSKDANEK
jgi:hypothetical protein